MFTDTLCIKVTTLQLKHLLRTFTFLDVTRVIRLKFDSRYITNLVAVLSYLYWFRRSFLAAVLSSVLGEGCGVWRCYTKVFGMHCSCLDFIFDITLVMRFHVAPCLHGCITFIVIKMVNKLLSTKKFKRFEFIYCLFVYYYKISEISIL